MKEVRLHHTMRTEGDVRPPIEPEQETEVKQGSLPEVQPEVNRTQSQSMEIEPAGDIAVVYLQQ